MPVWVGSSLNDVRGFSREVRQMMGAELFRVQHGKNPINWKPMKTVGVGVLELRVSMADQHRLIYIAKYAEAVYVLHAFAKKTEGTAKKDIEKAKARLQDVETLRVKT